MKPAPSVAAPIPERPYWLWADGTRASVGELLVAFPDTTDSLLDRHVDVIASLNRAGLAARARGEHREALRLLSAASRLCMEAIGHFPASAVRSDE
jgi:hypothetical protein